MEQTGDMPTAPNTGLKQMDEVALIAAIDDADNRAYGSNLSNLTAQLSAERALNIDLYLGKNVDPAPEGQSQAIDRTVFETVQWILPSLCNIFANGDDVVNLAPIDADDIDQARQETAYLNWLVTKKYGWFDLFLEWATDALLTKNAYFLVYRDNKTTVEIEKYEDQTEIGISYLLQDPNCELIESQKIPAPDLAPIPVTDQHGQPIIGENGQPMTRPAFLYNCTIRRRSDRKDLCIRVLPPERVKVDQRAYSWRIDDRCNYFEYWEETTLTELREQGFDVPTDIADDPEIYTQEDYARDQYGERRLERYKPSDPSMRRVKARMIWIRVDYNGDGKAELIKVVRVGRRILDMEEVSRIPVASGVSCPLPHRHLGISIADMVSDIQRYKTAILRQGLDNLYLSNNPQKIINEQMVNIDDAMVSLPGGLIRATDINQIRYEEAPFVFPQAIQGLEYMDQIRQNRTGVNNNFSGIDSRDLNNIQPGTVSQLSSMAAQRVEQIARILAFGIEDLFSIIHEQVLKMGHKRETLQIAGKWVEVNPGSWKKRTDFTACVAFSAGNRETQMARLAGIASKQETALQMGLPVVNAENYFATLMEMTKASGLSSPERFWTDPSQVPPPAPKPPPEGIVQAQIKAESDQKIKASEILQREIESIRKAELERYAIDSNTGIQVVQKHLEHGHTVSMEGVKASNAAVLATLDHKLNAGKSADSAHNHAQSSINGVTLDGVHSMLSDVLDHVKTTSALATARKVIRKTNMGDIEGIDHLDPAGNILKSQTAIKDGSGRIVGMQ